MAVEGHDVPKSVDGDTEIREQGRRQRSDCPAMFRRVPRQTKVRWYSSPAPLAANPGLRLPSRRSILLDPGSSR